MNNIKLNVICPITQEVIGEPVTTPGRHTYEGYAIRKWVQSMGKSPLTQGPVSLSDLAPNYALIEAEQSAQEMAIVNDGIEPVIDEQQSFTIPQTRYHTLECVTESNETLTAVTISGPDVDGVPCAISLVIDVSGSMDMHVSVQNADGTVENHGLSRLDITKHGAKTIIQNMRDCDQIAIIAFSDRAIIQLPLTQTTATGKETACNVITGLSTVGCTNLYSGIKIGLDEVAKSDKNIHRTVMVLTDGVSNNNPPSGILPSLMRYQQENQIDAVIDTFGFCYDLDSMLLNDIAVFGNGSYSFIPDGGMVGSVFIDAISNTLTTIARNVNVNIDVPNLNVIGEYPLSFHGNSTNINVGTVRAGQPKSVVFDKIVSDDWEAVGCSQPDAIEKKLEINQGILVTYNNFDDDKLEYGIPDGDAQLEYHRERLAVVSTIQTIFNSMITNCTQGVEQIVRNEIECLTRPELIKDLGGQVAMAVSTVEYWNKWGQHYLPSLQSAHLHCRCNNFKDGVQIYGGTVFKELRRKCENVFMDLPSPMPSIHGYNAPVQARGYYNTAGGCVGYNSSVMMGDGTYMAIHEIKKGDIIATPDGGATTVRCLVITPKYKCKMAKLGTLLITPWHPIRVNKVWEFPDTLVKKYGLYEEYDNEVYNMVLDRNHIAIIDGIECCTLGHGFKGEVIGHEYFGTRKVLLDLFALPGWNDGNVILYPQSYTRNPTTNLVNGLTIGEY